jgi:hypothetical protein
MRWKVPDEFLAGSDEAVPLTDPEVGLVVIPNHDEPIPAAFREAPAEPAICLSLSTVISEEMRSQIDQNV